nr:hypothetical protein [Nonomuraea antri]
MLADLPGEPVSAGGRLPALLSVERDPGLPLRAPQLRFEAAQLLRRLVAVRSGAMPDRRQRPGGARQVAAERVPAGGMQQAGGAGLCHCAFDEHAHHVVGHGGLFLPPADRPRLGEDLAFPAGAPLARVRRPGDDDEVDVVLGQGGEVAIRRGLRHRRPSGHLGVRAG